MSETGCMAQDTQSTSVRGYYRTDPRTGKRGFVPQHSRSYQPTTLKSRASSALKTVCAHPRGSLTIAGIATLAVGCLAAAPVVAVAGAGVAAVGSQRGARRAWSGFVHPMVADIASTMRKPDPERERRELRKGIDSMLAGFEAKPSADLTIEELDAAEELRAIRHHMDLEDIDREFEEQLRRAAGQRTPEQRQKISASAGRRKHALELRFPSIDFKGAGQKLWGDGFRDLNRLASAPLLPSPEKLPPVIHGEALASWGVCDLIETIFDGVGEMTRPSDSADITARF